MSDGKFKWFATTEWPLAFGAAPKAGSSSIRRAVVQEGKDYYKVDPRKYARRLFLVRHPVDRFKSLWKNKCRDGGKIMLVKRLAQHPITGLSPSELFEYIQEHKNYHWASQSCLLDNIEAELVRLENMGEWWDAWPHSTLRYPHTNRTEGDVEVDDTLLLRLEDYYAEDMKLYEDAQ